jgi:hypothetical protein
MLKRHFAMLTAGTVLLGAGFCQAKVINALNCSYSAVSNAIAQASPGDTVQLPAGYAVWTNSETPITGITLAGTIINGTNFTTIGDNFPSTAMSFNRFFVVRPTNTALTRITGITFQDAGNAVHNYRGKMEFDSRANLPGTSWRLDHCNFVNLNGDNVFVHGFANSVIDHCTFVLQGIGVEQYGITLTDPFGDVSYATPPYYGTNVSPCSPLYIEDCIFTNIVPSSSSSAAYDAVGGARSVFRHNIVLNNFWVNHGNDTSARYRSCRSFEIYNNTFADSQGFVGAMDFRGGTGVIFSNTATGYTFFDTAENYRSVEYNYWGEAGGTDSWDSNSPTVFLTATNSGVSGGVLAIGPIGQGTVTVAGAQWVANQWAGYMFQDPKAGCYWYNGSPPQYLTNGQENAWLIQGNSANQLFFTAGKDYVLLVTNGDVFNIYYCGAALDQVGRGSGDLIQDLTVYTSSTSTTYTFNTVNGFGSSYVNNRIWPHQISEPLYAWGNTLNGNPAKFGSGYTSIVEGRDYTNNIVKPGYTPMTYPHPLVTGTNNTSGFAGSTPPGTYPLTVSGGAGSGNYAAGTVVNISALRVGGEAFANWSGDTNYLANPAIATTVLIMPANIVNLIATYTATNTLPQTGSTTGITDGLVAQWPLAGDVNDHFGLNNGVAYGSPFYLTGPAGTANSAILLNGSSQYVLTTGLGTFGNTCASGFTMTAWVQSSYTSSYEAIFGSQGMSGMAVSLYLNFAGSGVGAGKIEGVVRDGVNSLHTCDVQSNSGITDGNWHFIAWVDNPAANSGTIYVDGVPLNTVMPQSAAVATTGLANSMGLGIRSGLNDGLFNGALADCRIYSRTLSATEIGTLFSNGAATTANPTGVMPPTDLQAHPPGGQ